ncbi:hypothetical protein MKW92_043637, partial [Papaver armeniacum]
IMTSYEHCRLQNRGKCGVGMQMTTNGAAINVRSISKRTTLCAQQIIALFVRFFGVVAVHKYSGGSTKDIKLKLKSWYVGDRIRRVRLNDCFIKDDEIFLVGSLQVTKKMITNCNLINPTLDYACGCLPSFSQWLGFLLRPKWPSKEVLFLESKGETPCIAASTWFLPSSLAIGFANSP